MTVGGVAVCLEGCGVSSRGRCAEDTVATRNIAPGIAHDTTAVIHYTGPVSFGVKSLRFDKSIHGWVNIIPQIFFFLQSFLQPIQFVG